DIHLGHCRLSILGLKTGDQPISSRNGQMWIIYNGEVFNYLELKSDLEKKGHRFITDTDTEVVLRLYEEYGPQCLPLLNGQFAMAIWDAGKKELFLARDRVGICPLYYTFRDGRFLFASEIKAVFLDPAVTRQIDLQALAQVFTFWTTVGEKTIFKDVFELRPGHYMLVRKNQDSCVQQPYWEIPFYPPEDQYKGTQEQAAEELAALLEDAVRLRLRADVPVGAYLSGGLDSSVITSIISNKFNNRLKTFSIGFEEKSFDEASYQADMVKYLCTDHYQTHITNTQVSEFLPQVVWHAEKPLLRTGPVPLFMLSKLVHSHNFKVVLTGEGADEVFGGYNIFKEAKVRAFWARQPDSKYRPLLLERLYPYIFENSVRARAFLRKFFSVTSGDLKDPLMSHQKRWDNTGWCTTFFNSARRAELQCINPLDEIRARLPAGFSQRDILSRAQWLEMDIFMSNYLLSSQGDRVAMANSVELRPPFLDHRLIDFAARLPAHWKINGLNEKYLLKKAFADKLPENIVNRPKQPYRAPIGQAFFTKPGMRVNELIDPDQLKRAGIFNPQKVKNLLVKYLEKGQGPASEVQNMAVAGILSTQMLHEQFIEGFADLQIKTPAVIPDKIIHGNRHGEFAQTLAAN
ncbi:MAG: asparagine synthase (glutamine-hydrolyzing), partial [Desulfosalsimonadaceae bacterium]